MNYKLVTDGQAYPLFYDTLFPDLRATLAKAAAQARAAKKGLWGMDVSQTGLAFPDQAALEARAVIFPKLFRRLTEYLTDHDTGPAGFLPWLKTT